MARGGKRDAKGQGVAATGGLLLENGVLRVGSHAIFEGVSPRFELETVRDDRVRSECTGELVRDLDPVHIGMLSLEENAGGPSGAHRPDPVSRHVVQIASRLPTTSRFVANARCKLWWMTPTWGTSECGSIPPETQFLLLEMRTSELGEGGATGRTSAETSVDASGRRLREKRSERSAATTYVAALPLISADGFRATLSGHALDAKTARAQRHGTETRGDRKGERASRPLCLVAESNDARATSHRVDSVACIAVASSPFEAAEAVVAAASRRMRTFGLRVHKVVPPTVEVFGWCTWDAFYHSVTPAGVEAGVASLASGGTPARFVIVDDGWQSVTPDAAYRKKVDHISDHPPGSPVAKDGDARALQRSSSLPATPTKAALVGRADGGFGAPGTDGTSSPGAPENASPVPSSRASPVRDDGDASGANGRMTRLARVTRSAAAANPLRRETFSRAKSRLRQSVSNLASTEVHRGNDRIENAMATALVAAQTAAKQAHIPVPTLSPAKAWWPTRAAAAVAAGVASGLESAYWHGVHSSPYLGVSWHWFRFLGQGVLGPAIRAAVSTLSCFNHRVSFVEANVKFRTAPGSDARAPSDEAAFASHPPGSPALAAGRVGEKAKRDARDGAGTDASFARLERVRGKKRRRADGLDGFAEVVARIKRLGVDHVYCWHALFGYWGGLHPDAVDMKRYRPVMTVPRHTPGLLAVEPSQAWDPITLGGVGVCERAEDLGAFYRELHAYLARAGVDGVKVDGQAVVGGLGHGRGGGPRLARRLHAMLEASVKTHFPTNGLINCMCHSSENILNFRESSLARVSDDFYPTNRASHTVHVANVAYNSVFMGEIVVPDWDMFQSHCGEAGALHAAARAVGGCPVYVSDAPGKHDFALLRKLVFPSGRVLRASLPGRPTRDCVFRDPCADGATALKIWNKNARVDCGVVGAFNVQGASWSRAKGIFVERREDAAAFVVAEVSPGDVETLRRSVSSDGDERAADAKDDVDARASSSSKTKATREASFAVHAHRSGETRVLRLGDAWRVKLRPKQWEIFAVAKTRRADADDASTRDLEWAFIGLTGMLNGGGAVLRDAHFVERAPRETKKSAGPTREATPGALVATATVYGCGSLAAVATRKPRRVEVDGESVAFRFDRDATDAAGERKGGRVLVPLGPREDTHEVRMRFEA